MHLIMHGNIQNAPDEEKWAFSAQLFFFLGWGSMEGPCIDMTLENCILREQIVGVWFELCCQRQEPCGVISNPTGASSSYRFMFRFLITNKKAEILQTVFSLHILPLNMEHEVGHIHFIKGDKLSTAVILSGMDLYISDCRKTRWRHSLWGMLMN